MTEVKKCVSTEKKIQLKELLNNFPVEIKHKSDQSFSFIDWGMAEEKKIAKLKDKNYSMGKFIGGVLCHMLDTVNGENFQNKEEKEKKLIINQLPMANVLYLYIYLRYDQLGNEINIDFDCSSCGKLVDNFTADLGDIDVDCKYGDYEEIVDYKLKKPITLEKGQQLIDTIKIKIATWDVMEKADLQSSTDEATMKEHTFRCSIVGTNAETRIATDTIIKKMKKIDIEMLNKKISIHNAGATIQAEIECTKCSQKSIRQIDWGYESFFGPGSLPAN